MKTCKKKNLIDNFADLEEEIRFDQVEEIFRTRPNDPLAALAEIGFEYHDDDDDDEVEEREESQARPETKNQKKLVAYFAGELEWSDALVEAFLRERRRPQPNLPLFRKYFRQANAPFKALLLRGLDLEPTNEELLADLAFFHEFENCLSLLIHYYTQACVNQTDLQAFTELARDFYYDTNPDGYEALDALRELFPADTEKGKVINFLIAETEAAQHAVDPVKF